MRYETRRFVRHVLTVHAVIILFFPMFVSVIALFGAFFFETTWAQTTWLMILQHVGVAAVALVVLSLSIAACIRIIEWGSDL